MSDNDRWKNLPKGLDQVGWTDKWLEFLDDTPPKNLICTCGVSKTMGKDDDIQFHSIWCDLRLKEKK